jgi:hypothetical protein
MPAPRTSSQPATSADELPSAWVVGRILKMPSGKVYIDNGQTWDELDVTVLLNLVTGTVDNANLIIDGGLLD